MPNMTDVVKAAAVSPSHAPIAAATARPLRECRTPESHRYTPYPTNGMVKAMFRQLAPMAVTPPSAKRRAWMIRAMLMASAAPHGPTAMAIKTPPTAWPVVAAGNGTLNIITTKLNAAEMASKGARFAASVALTFLAATPQSGAQATNEAR